jgi:hypothetical protein
MEDTGILPPNFIYVSELLRTWETAVLLFLSLLNTNLTLYISPFLRETGIFPSDKPGYLKEQVKEFVRFIALLRELKKSNIVGVSILIPERFTIILKHFGGAFTDDFIAGIETPEGVELIIEDGGIQIVCDFSENTGLPSRIDSSKQSNIARMFAAIVVPNEEYVPSNEVSSELVFPLASDVRNVGSMDKPSTPPGSLADFVNWYNNLHPKPGHNGNDDIVTAVSHSGTMKNFVKAIKSPSSEFNQEFNQEFDKAIGTNTCSLVFKTGTGPTFNIFRHAYSCDNRNMHKGTITSTSKRFGDSGIYASLSLWGILSTLKFSNQKMQSLIAAQEIGNPPGLKICRGMDKESDTYLADTYDSTNVLCGEQRDRMPIGNFSLSLGHCGTSGGLLPTFDKNCIRIITDPKGPKVVLYLDKEKKVIQARFFKSAITSTTYDSKIVLSEMLLDQQLNSIVSHFFSSLVSFDDNAPVSYLKLELIESIKTFIESNTDIDLEWKELLTPLYRSYTYKKAEKAVVGYENTSMFDNLPPLGMVTAGGTNKRTQRHRKHKVMKKYTRKNKKYNPRRKSRRIRKRKQTYKRKSRKSRK